MTRSLTSKSLRRSANPSPALLGPALSGKQFKKMRGRAHWHGCTQCHLAYDDACETPRVNGVCVDCRGGRPRSLLMRGRDPKGCCIDNTEMVDDEVRARYKLAGPGPWYQCRICYRSHPKPVLSTPMRGK